MWFERRVTEASPYQISHLVCTCPGYPIGKSCGISVTNASFRQLPSQSSLAVRKQHAGIGKSDSGILEES